MPRWLRAAIAAYELTLRALDLVDRNDPLTAMIADKIMEIGATGLKNPAEISKRAAKLLTANSNRSQRPRTHPSPG